jgi:hypothetical protein
MELCITVGIFVDRMSLTDINLRIGPAAGPKMAKVESHICEAVLYLVGGARIVPVAANSLGRWMQLKGFEASNQAHEKCWQYAFAAAAHATERDGVEVKLSGQE